LIGMLMGSVLGILVNQESSRVSREPRARGGFADARRDGRRRASVVACLSSRVTRARVVTDCVLEVGATRYEMAILSMRDECIFSNFIN